MSLVENVEVERNDDGRLRVSWKMAGDCQNVDLAWGRSADGLDHERVMTVPAARGEAWLDVVPGGSGRVYVSVAPAVNGNSAGAGAGPGATVGAERRIGLRGPVNFRDLGGYRSADGRKVRWGKVFRSDALVLHDDDLAAFAGLGIRTVYDLRSEGERDSVPSRFPDHAQPAVVVRPLVSSDGETTVIDELAYTDGESFLEQLYQHTLVRAAVNIGDVLTGLSEPTNLPAVFHCAAGKDRTGMVAAVLLSVLDVRLDDILDDYELTSRYRTTEHVNASMQRLSETGKVAPEIAAGILRSPRWAMQSAITKVTERYGGMNGYLTGPAGVAGDVPQRLRDLLLTP
jgi:protein-tyrosine phosphatase